MKFKKISRLNESVQIEKPEFIRKPHVITPGKHTILAFVKESGSVNEMTLSAFVNGLNEKNTVTSMEWVRENGRFFNTERKNSHMIISLSELGEKVLKESSSTENVNLEIIGEGKLATVKRQYGAYGAKTVQISTPVRNKILSYVSENEKVTRSQFIEFLKQTNEESGRKTSFAWVRRNAHFFKVVEDKETKEKFYTLSAFGKRVLSKTTVNENVSAEEVLNEDYSEALIKAIGDKLGIDITKYDMNQLKIGMEITLMAHGSKAGAANIIDDDPVASLQLVLGNLKLDPNFYTSAKPEEWGKEFFDTQLTSEPIEVDADIKTVDTIPGGKGDGMSIKDIANKHNVSEDELNNEYEVGKAVEREHTDSDEKAEEIAKDHLSEDPKYYTKLIQNGLADEEDAIALAKKLLGVEPKEKSVENEEEEIKKGEEGMEKGEEDKGEKEEDKGEKEEDKGEEEKENGEEDENKKLLTDEQKEKVKSLISEYKDKGEVPEEVVSKLADEFEISAEDLTAYIEIQMSKEEKKEDESGTSNESVVNEHHNKVGSQVKIKSTGQTGTLQSWSAVENVYKILLDDGTGKVVDAPDEDVETIEQIGENVNESAKALDKYIIQSAIEVAMQYTDDEGAVAAANQEWNDINDLVKYLKDFIKPRVIKSFSSEMDRIAKKNNLQIKEMEMINEDDIPSGTRVKCPGGEIGDVESWNSTEGVYHVIMDSGETKQFKDGELTPISNNSEKQESKVEMKLGEDYQFTKGLGTVTTVFEESFIVEWEDGEKEEINFADLKVHETDAATVYNTPGIGNVILPSKDVVGSGDKFDVDATIPANAGLNRKQGRYQMKKLQSMDNFIKNSLQESKTDIATELTSDK